MHSILHFDPHSVHNFIFIIITLSGTPADTQVGTLPSEWASYSMGEYSNNVSNIESITRSMYYISYPLSHFPME